MIQIRPDGGPRIDFDDWTGDMMNLSTRLYRMPPHPACGGYGNHEVGIEQLAQMKYGGEVIKALCQLAGELAHQPTAEEVVALGQAWLAHKAEMELLRRSRASRGRQEKADAHRRHAQARFRRPTGTPRFGFVRGV